MNEAPILQSTSRSPTKFCVGHRLNSRWTEFIFLRSRWPFFRSCVRINTYAACADHNFVGERSMAMNFKPLDSFKENLIDHVQSFTWLLNVKHPDYYDAGKKTSSWETIAKTLKDLEGVVVTGKRKAFCLNIINIRKLNLVHKRVRLKSKTSLCAIQLRLVPQHL